jgi:hypothetical protein
MDRLIGVDNACEQCSYVVNVALAAQNPAQ